MGLCFVLFFILSSFLLHGTNKHSFTHMHSYYKKEKMKGGGKKSEKGLAIDKALLKKIRWIYYYYCPSSAVAAFPFFPSSPPSAS